MRLFMGVYNGWKLSRQVWVDSGHLVTENRPLTLPRYLHVHAKGASRLDQAFAAATRVIHGDCRSF